LAVQFQPQFVRMPSLSSRRSVWRGGLGELRGTARVQLRLVAVETPDDPAFARRNMDRERSDWLYNYNPLTVPLEEPAQAA